MAIKLGSTSFGLIYLGSSKIGQAYLGSVKVYPSGPDPYNPLGLPQYTIRLKFNDGVTPSFSKGTATQVSSSPNVWDLSTANETRPEDWSDLVRQQSDLLAVLGANSTNVAYASRMFDHCIYLTDIALFDTRSVTTAYSMFQFCYRLPTVPQFDFSSVGRMDSMFQNDAALTSVPLFDTRSCISFQYMFQHCTHLTSVPQFNTSNATTLQRMLDHCTSLTAIPLFDTSSVTNMEGMCYETTSVASGALSLYQQASTKTPSVSNHDYTFHNCGSNTTSGATELAQIPSNWK